MNKLLWKFSGAILVGFLGWLISYKLSLLLLGNDNSGFIVIVIMVFMGILLGTILGFVIAGEKFKKHQKKV
ncbi:hypothetical protein MPF19_12770 [Polaribacter sp. Z014]|uniref:hypothetical protein n=1 Tax=Polaribacter sp. Z014 TaxID=2927126 RepID=UPI0020214D40|nr:hypothetical protein [Polaribacter sp. Z014]MCL7764292.1 hypothetical protein [Polaribacter sp. Z014]